MSLLCLHLLLLGLLYSVSGEDDGNGLPDDAAVNKIEYNGSPVSEQIQQRMDFYRGYLPVRGTGRDQTKGEPTEGTSGGRARQLGGMNAGFGMGGVWPPNGALLGPGGQMSLDAGGLQFATANMAGAADMDPSGGLAVLMSPGGQLTGEMPIELNSGVSADLAGIADAGPQFRGGGGFGGGYGGGFGGFGGYGGGFYGGPFYPPIPPPFFYGAVPVPFG